jgi:hypothetical protein
MSPHTAGATTAKCKELHAINATVCMAWNTYKVVLNIMCSQFVAAIHDIYYAVLNDPTEGLNAIDLCSLIMHILTTYAKISQPDLDDNMTEFQSGIELGLLLAVYMRKQEKCQIFAEDGHPQTVR